MAIPDIQLKPGDTAPMTRITLYDPPAADGTPGLAADIQGWTGTFKYERRSGGTVSSRVVTVMQSSPTVNRGVIQIDWLGTGGPVSTTNLVPLDYNAHVIMLDTTGHQETWPNGPDRVKADGTNEAFWWMQVSRALG